MKTKEKIKLFVKITSFKEESGKITRKTTHFVEVGGMLRPVYIRPEMRNVGYTLSLPVETFNSYFQFEIPDYQKGNSNNDTEQ